MSSQTWVGGSRGQPLGGWEGRRGGESHGQILMQNHQLWSPLPLERGNNSWWLGAQPGVTWSWVWGSVCLAR